MEDNELNREIAAEILGMTGVAVDIAENGKSRSKRLWQPRKMV